MVGETEVEPPVPILPPQEAVQLEVFWLLQVRVVVPPWVMLVGSADRVTDGVAGWLTVTAVDSVVSPPAPVQVRVYV